MKKERKYLCVIATFDELWGVYLVDPFEMQSIDSSMYDGLTINTNHEILISSVLDEFRQRETVYHEVTHAFNNSLYGRKENFTHEEMCDFIGRYGIHIHTQSQKILDAIEKCDSK